MYFEFLFVGFHLHLETVKSEIKKFNLLKEDFYVNTSLVWKYSKIIFSILITWIIMPAFEKINQTYILCQESLSIVNDQ